MNHDDTTSAAFDPDGHRDGLMDPIAQVRAYWEGLRDDDVIPLRSQINPRGIEQALSSTFLIERVAPGVARFRIAGMDLADVMGMEVRGLPISAIFMPTGRAELMGKLEQVFAGPAVLTLNLVAPAGLGRPALTARMIIMPLRDEDGKTGLALGCIALTGGIGRSPRRFEISHTSLTALAQKQAPAPKPAPAPRTAFAPQMVAKNDARMFAEAADQFDASTNTKTSKPYLRVVK